jgi:hypothetical protein
MDATAQLAHMIEFQANDVLPKGQLRVPVIGVQTNINMLLRQIH